MRRIDGDEGRPKTSASPESVAWASDADDSPHAATGHHAIFVTRALRKELQSLVDCSRCPDVTSSAAIDPLFGVSSITNGAGQASTTHASFHGGATNAAYVSFGRALGYVNGQWIEVHGAGAQRSDPKIGDPADYPEGHGPQGDAIRGYDSVRCVRGGAVPTAPGTSGSGGAGAGGGLPGPTACSEQADCALPGACPPDAALGCSCLPLAEGGQGCIPTCDDANDCPVPPAGPSLVCSNDGLCVRAQ